MQLKICNVFISKVLPIGLAVFMVIYWIAGLANSCDSVDSTTLHCKVSKKLRALIFSVYIRNLNDKGTPTINVGFV